MSARPGRSPDPRRRRARPTRRSCRHVRGHWAPRVPPPPRRGESSRSWSPGAGAASPAGGSGRSRAPRRSARSPRRRTPSRSSAPGLRTAPGTRCGPAPRDPAAGSCDPLLLELDERLVLRGEHPRMGAVPGVVVDEVPEVADPTVEQVNAVGPTKKIGRTLVRKKLRISEIVRSGLPTSGNFSRGVVHDCLLAVSSHSHRRSSMFCVRPGRAGPAGHTAARAEYHGLEQADSFILDPHKGLFTRLTRRLRGMGPASTRGPGRVQPHLPNGRVRGSPVRVPAFRHQPETRARVLGPDRVMSDLLSLFDQRFEAGSSCGPAGQGWTP